MKYQIFALPAHLLTVLFYTCAGCGGGSDIKPTADAGVLQDVGVSSVVTLDGSGSRDPYAGPFNADSITYNWTQASGTTVVLSDSTAEQPTFTAGGTPDTYVFSLTVNNGWEDSDPSTVTIRVWTDVDNRLFVNASYSPSESGRAGDGSMDAPYTTINEAITAASDADNGADVYVAAGTYPENITMVEGVSLFGGYEATNWTRDITANTTTINPSEENLPTVTANGGVTSATFIDGFTITGPTYTDSSRQSRTIHLNGGGVMTISHNTISGGLAESNSVYTIHCEIGGDGLTISNNTITTGTTASTASDARAQGILLGGCTNVDISSNTISGSSDEAYSASGGVFLINVENASSATIQLNTIDAGKNAAENTVAVHTRVSGSATVTRNRIDGGDGFSQRNGSFGIMHGSDGNMTIENNIIYAGNGYSTDSNQTSSFAISLTGSSSANVVNNTIYLGGDTTSSSSKIGIQQSSSGTVNVVNNLIIQASGGVATQYSLYHRSSDGAAAFASVYNNDLTLTEDSYLYSDGTTTASTLLDLRTAFDTDGTSHGQNISRDPLLQDDSDYLLQAGSYCVDSGCTESSDCGDVTIPTEDYDGNPRPNGDAVDIGASEYQ